MRGLQFQLFDDQLPRLDFGQIENVIDNALQMRAGAQNGVNFVFDIFPALVFVAQHIRVAQDGGERGANFVTHVGEEFALGLVGGIRRFFGFTQLFRFQLAFHHHADPAANQIDQVLVRVSEGVFDRRPIGKVNRAEFFTVNFDGATDIGLHAQERSRRMIFVGRVVHVADSDCLG